MNENCENYFILLAVFNEFVDLVEEFIVFIVDVFKLILHVSFESIKFFSVLILELRFN